jgi:hypothetical protein
LSDDTIIIKNALVKGPDLNNFVKFENLLNKITNILMIFQKPHEMDIGVQNFK